jgi:hypothetical protein
MILSKTDNLGQCSQPGCHGTPGCHKEVSRVSPNLELLPLLHEVPPDCHFQQIKGATIFFIDLKGTANQKRLKKH